MSAETIRRLYEAFSAHDGEAMAACYAPDARFDDPVFTLAGSDVGDMWRMLTERGGARIAYEIVDEHHARWTADYELDGRPVHNEIASAFDFDAEGRIAAQVDTFDFGRWAAQALGWKGKLLGWTPFVRSAVHKQAAARLARWQQRR